MFARVEIQNAASLTNLKLSFQVRSSAPNKMNVFVGDHKTTILRSILAFQNGEDGVGTTLYNREDGLHRVSLSAVWKAKTETRLEWSYHSDGEVLEKPCLGYGPLLHPPLTTPTVITKDMRDRSLYTYAGPNIVGLEWSGFLTSDEVAQKVRNDYYEVYYPLFLQALSGVVFAEVLEYRQRVKTSLISREPSFLAKRSGGVPTWRYWSELSLFEQRMTMIIADILGWCYREGTSKRLKDIRAVVCIDDVDLYADPHEAAALLSKLTETFPNIQFFVTARNPLTLCLCRRGDVQRVYPDGRVQVLPDLSDKTIQQVCELALGEG